MKTLKYVTVALTAALALGISAFVLNSYANPTADAGSPFGGKLFGRVKQKLNLTDDQVAEIRAQLKPEKDNLTSLLTHLHDAREQLRAEIQKPDATESSVRDASAKVSAVESDLAVERLKLHAKISPILTADQRAKLAQLEAGADKFAQRAIDRMGAKLSD